MENELGMKNSEKSSYYCWEEVQQTIQSSGAKKKWQNKRAIPSFVSERVHCDAFVFILSQFDINK